MNISYQSNDSLTISSKGRTVVVGAEVKVENYVIPGAGEYDIATIQCEAYHLGQGLLYLIRSEDLTVTYLSKIDQEATKGEGVSTTNILIVDVRSDDKPEDLKPIVNRLEPSYVLLIGAGATPEFRSALSLPAYEGGALKVPTSSLPEQGTFLVPGK
jgi:hypothetical protein